MARCSECDGHCELVDPWASPDQWANGEAEMECFWCDGTGVEPEEEKDENP